MKKLSRTSLLLIAAAAGVTAFSFAASAQLVEDTLTWTLPPNLVAGRCPKGTQLSSDDSICICQQYANGQYQKYIEYKPQINWRATSQTITCCNNLYNPTCNLDILADEGVNGVLPVSPSFSIGAGSITTSNYLKLKFPASTGGQNNFFFEVDAYCATIRKNGSNKATTINHDSELQLWNIILLGYDRC
jgi:hypothetical protein